MAQEKQKIEAMLTGMDTKQKFMIFALAIFVIIIVWMVWGMFGSDEPETEIAATPAPVAQPGIPGGNIVAASSPSAAAPAPTPSQQLAEKQQINAQDDAQLIEDQKAKEKAYIDQVNQLQSLKLEQQIWDAQQAISAAKLAQAMAEKNRLDIIHPTPQQPAPVQENAYTNTMNPDMASQAPASPSTEVIQAPPPPVEDATLPDATYTVISISMEQGKWNAVLGYQGKLYTVSRGDTLDADGSIVSGINKNGVVLLKDKKKRKVNLVSPI